MWTPLWLVYSASLAVNCLPGNKWPILQYIRAKMMVWKKNIFFFFTSGRFCLTPGSAGVGLHFQEAPGWSRKVHMYAYSSWILPNICMQHDLIVIPWCHAKLHWRNPMASFWSDLTHLRDIHVCTCWPNTLIQKCYISFGVTCTIIFCKLISYQFVNENNFCFQVFAM